MTISEFSDQFDVLLNSFSRAADFGDTHSSIDIILDEYEKSVYLTKAQEEVVVNLYNGKNIYGDSFESTEEIRRYLDGLVKTKEYTSADTLSDSSLKHITQNSEIFELPEEIAFITLETVTTQEDGVNCGNEYTARVYPITHDEYDIIKDNPFRGITKYKALRLDYGDNKVEILHKGVLKKYFIKYLATPTPIILVDLPDDLKINNLGEATECSLHPLLHQTILQRAVALAVASRGRSSS